MVSFPSPGGTTISPAWSADGAHLAFSLYTHRSLFAGNQVVEVHEAGLPSLTRSVAMLAAGT